MRPCAFTVHLSRYEGPNELLEAHLGRCEQCRVASVVSWAVSESSTSGPCPSAGELAAFSLGALADDRAGGIVRHLEGCASCREVLGHEPAPSSEPDITELLVRAEREIDAYELAREIAEWLASAQFPREEGAVRQGFDAAFDSWSLDVSRDEAGVPALALGFEGRAEAPLAERLLGLAILAGDLARQGVAPGRERARRFRDRTQTLPDAFISADVVDAISSRLERAE